MHRSLASLALGGLALTWAGAAGAVERQHHIGVDGGLSMLDVADKSTLDVGGGLGLHYTYGLSDAFNFVAEGTGSIVALKQHLDQPTSPHTRPSTLSSLAVGVVYVLDVLRWVPYGGLLAGGYMLTGGTLDKATFDGGVQVALGVDYQVTRSFSAGLALRQHMLLTDLSTYPTYTTAFLRLEYVWGW